MVVLASKASKAKIFGQITIKKNAHSGLSKAQRSNKMTSFTFTDIDLEIEDLEARARGLDEFETADVLGGLGRRDRRLARYRHRQRTRRSAAIRSRRMRSRSALRGHIRRMGWTRYRRRRGGRRRRGFRRRR